MKKANKANVDRQRRIQDAKRKDEVRFAILTDEQGKDILVNQTTADDISKETENAIRMGNLIRDITKHFVH